MAGQLIATSLRAFVLTFAAIPLASFAPTSLDTFGAWGGAAWHQLVFGQGHGRACWQRLNHGFDELSHEIPPLVRQGSWAREP